MGAVEMNVCIYLDILKYIERELSREGNMEVETQNRFLDKDV